MSEKRVALVVEDNPPDARLVEELLRETAPNFRCVNAVTLVDAVEYLTSEHADVVLLDADLPDSRGEATVRRVLEAAPKTPVVVLTGNDDERFGAACLHLGAQDFIVKACATPALLAWSVRNADARKRVELALQESEANYRGLFENSCFAIAQIRPDGTIIRANRRFADLLGVSTLPLTAEINIATYFVDRSIFDKISEFRDSPFHDIEASWRQSDGSMATLLLSGRHVTGASNQTTGWMEIIAHDVSKRRQLEDQLRQAQKLEAVAQLAGGVAHDLNNVLAIIIAEVESAQLAWRDGGSAEMDDELAVIGETARRGARLVKYLLGYSRQQKLTCETLDLGRVVSDVVDMARRLIPQTIYLTIDGKTDRCFVNADITAVEQIVLNLITNARDAVGSEGTISVSTCLISLTEEEARRCGANEAGRYASVTVTDDGVGMSSDIKTRVFEPFFSTKPKGVGTGLGLSSVHGLVAQHHGFVSIESEPGFGTSVSVCIPSATPSAVAAGEQIDVPQSELRGTEAILLVDDEVHLRRVGQRLLERFGYRVFTAADGDEALQTFRDQNGQIDLVITDVVMPGTNGLVLRDAIQRIDPSMPFLFMSGYSEEELPRIVASETPISTIDKPWEITQILSAARQVLRPGEGGERREGRGERACSR